MGSEPPPRSGPGRKSRNDGLIFEHDLALGAEWVAGADEAGRGCLAGPIVGAAVVLDRECLSGRGGGLLEGLHDSKKLTAKARERLFPAILDCAVRTSVALRSARYIDTHGLQRANNECLAGAMAGLAATGDQLVPLRLVDGFELKGWDLEHRRLIKGDATSAAVAAASVIAKVTRDRLMIRAGGIHPGYGFEGHKGYASAAHREAIIELGPSPIHRLSFDSSAYNR
ncbi:MAG: ribonuclease HII [Solirubrobacterales bacterium]|nr:ribonuclease HII [Solirubrobacterales bacterium]